MMKIMASAQLWKIKFFGKRGLSNVVATIALILITVAAAGVIAGIVVPLLPGWLNEGTECIGYEDYFQFYEEFEFNCYRLIDEGTTRYYLIGISLQADTVADDKVENLKGFRLGFVGEGSSKGVDVFQDTEASSSKEGIRMLNPDEEIRIPEQGLVETYVYNATGTDYKYVEVYPVLQSDRQCERTDRIRIAGRFCGPEVDLGVPQ